MEDPGNITYIGSSPKGFGDDKHVLDSPETGTHSPPAAAATATATVHWSHLVSEKLSTWGVESRGIQPVDVEDRTETHFVKIFFVWFSANTTVVPFALGTLGPTAFGLSLSESCLAVFLFNMIFSIYPAYYATFGPRLGLRQLCMSRYTYGYYGAIVPSLLSIIRGFGFCILSTVLGGQVLGSLADIGGSIGILIIGGASLFISFGGIKFVNWYENYAWIPVVVVFVVVASVNGKHFVDAPVTPGTLAQISNFAVILSGQMLPWAALSSDYTVYFHPRVSSWRIFAYSYLGFCMPTIALQCLGAAAAASSPFVPHWKAGYAQHGVAGLLDAMLSPVGKFGKCLMIILSLSVTAANAPTIYSMSLAFQTFIPPLVARPRYVFSVFAVVLINVLALAGLHKSNANLSDFLGIIEYWAGTWVVAVLVEHMVIRKRKFANYDVRSWDIPSQLPLGAAALGSSILGFGLAIPTISQVWYTGPIGRKFGDAGIAVSMLLTALFYFPLRRLEKYWRGF